MAGVKLSTGCQESETNGLLRAIPRTLDKQISRITLIEIVMLPVCVVHVSLCCMIIRDWTAI